MNQRTKPGIGVIGAGSVGCTLAQLLKNSGYPIIGLSTRTRESLENALSFLDLPPGKGKNKTGSWIEHVDLLFLTVPDDQIRNVARQISKENPPDPDTLVLHCSGASGAGDLLSPLAQHCRIGSFHPLQTIPDPQTGVTSLPGSWISISGDEETLQQLRSLAHDLNTTPFVVPDDKRSLYHAAAVFACNHTIALLSISEELMKLCTEDVENPLTPLTPLIKSSLENTLEKGAREALTGPAARGDLETMQSHLTALRDTHPEWTDPYIALTEQCLKLAEERGSIDPEKVKEITKKLRKRQTEQNKTGE